MQPNPFAEMLQPGEVVLAQLAGEGRPEPRGRRVERTWWQLGLSRDRLLAIRMREAESNDRWDVIERITAPRVNLRFLHFPRTATDTARLTIEGTSDPIILIDVDREPVLQQVAPFLQAWGGPVAGGDTVAQQDDDAYNAGPKDEKKTLLYIGGAMIAMFAICCGCAGVMGVIRVVLDAIGG